MIDFLPEPSPWQSSFSDDANKGNYYYYPETELRDLLEEIVNTPLLKIPFWIIKNKDKLKQLGIKIRRKINDKNSTTKS